jgi:ferredoxin/flavodoxin---NADP+ reductase
MKYVENPRRYLSRVLANELVSPTARVLTLERVGLPFQAGHEILLHGRDHTEDRQYSIASGESEDTLRILYRVIPEGVMTPRLATLEPGAELEFTGPFGSFLIRDFLAPLVFIATGTGIAPALSFIRSHPGLDLTVLHGVRAPEDLFSHTEFDPAKFHPCVSRCPGPGHFAGRVTAKCREMTFSPDAHFYLCGANDMILEMRRQLKAGGVEDARIFAEAYYFW